jgi:lipid-A-disaccharide synthase
MTAADNKRLSVYLVAGEASGDLLGSRLMEAIRAKTPDVEFHGVGGSKMKAQGLSSLFPFEELSIFGIAEVILHIPRIFELIRETFEDIRSKQPDMVITIDSPGFTFRLAERLAEHKQTQTIKRVHYVAPTVWAYKPQRAKWVARIFHHMLLLLPFEPPYFEAENLPCTFVGHPVAWEWKQKGSGDRFRSNHHVSRDCPLLCMLPGSRKGELNRLLPIFEQTVLLLSKKIPGITPVIVAATAMEAHTRAMCKSWKITPIIVSESEKKDAFAASNIALAKSGTVALELPLAGVPTLVTYKVSAYTAWALKRMLKIKFANLINLLLDLEVIPEMLQDKCKPDLLAEKLHALYQDATIQHMQKTEVQKALAMLGMDDTKSPSEKAADVVLSLLQPPSR